MKPITAEWVQKAEGDLATAEREVSATDAPNYDAACFHAQQCVEKYLKARLVEAGIDFPKTHDLGALLDLVSPVEPEWQTFRQDLDSLTDLGVEVRYPGAFAGADDAEQAVRAARQVRERARAALGLST